MALLVVESTRMRLAGYGENDDDLLRMRAHAELHLLSHK